MSVLEMDAYLSRRIIWRAGRVACRAGAERSASFAVSSVSLPQNPAALTCPNARSALTELLACLREGGGRRGTWMNEKNPHPPTGRQAGRQAGRTDGAQLFQAFLGGGGREPAGARGSFFCSFSPSFQPTSLRLLPPTRTPGLPGASSPPPFQTPEKITSCWRRSPRLTATDRSARAPPVLLGSITRSAWK